MNSYHEDLLKRVLAKYIYRIWLEHGNDWLYENEWPKDEWDVLEAAVNTSGEVWSFKLGHKVFSVDPEQSTDSSRK